MSGCPGILVEVPKVSSLPEMANGSSWKAFQIPKQVPKPTMAKMSKFYSENNSGVYNFFRMIVRCPLKPTTSRVRKAGAIILDLIFVQGW